MRWGSGVEFGMARGLSRDMERMAMEEEKGPRNRMDAGQLGLEWSR